MYLPVWVLILLALLIAGAAYEEGARKVRAAWRKSERERRERRRLRKEQKKYAAAMQRIRDQYGEDLDDEAVTMIYDLESDPYFSPETRNLAIAMEMLEDYRRKKKSSKPASPTKV